MINYYLGIDVGKCTHVGCLTNEQGVVLVKPFRFANTGVGYRQLVAHLNNHVGEAAYPTLHVGFEATGPYWLTVYSFLKKLGCQVTVLNPLQVRAYRNQGIRGSKTDNIDALLIARILRFGDYQESSVPQENDVALRQLTRTRFDIVRTVADQKKKVLALFDQVFPEYKDIFSNFFCEASLKLLETAILPEEIAALPTAKLQAVFQEASRGKVKADKAVALKKVAQSSIGVTVALDAFSMSIKLLLDQIKHLESQIHQLDKVIASHLEKEPTPITSIPGIGPVIAATIKAEIGNFNRFKDDKEGAEKIVALAGLDPKLKESGSLKGQVKMSKRGSPYLRVALRQAAFIAACSKKEPFFRAIYEKQIGRGKHFEVALTHVAHKMIHVAFSLMKHNRAYQSQLT